MTKAFPYAYDVLHTVLGKIDADQSENIELIRQAILAAVAEDQLSVEVYFENKKLSKTMNGAEVRKIMRILRDYLTAYGYGAKFSVGDYDTVLSISWCE
jgi:hypothetical protein